MKMPKTFVPKKDLEEKTKQLLKKPILNRTESEKEKFEHLYGEAKKEFPNLIDYLLGLYPDLEIVKVKDREKLIWRFCRTQCPIDFPAIVGTIETYREHDGRDTAEYGLKAQVLVEGRWRNIKYRKGWHCYGGTETIISPENPYRYDNETEVPFP